MREEVYEDMSQRIRAFEATIPEGAHVSFLWGYHNPRERTGVVAVKEPGTCWVACDDDGSLVERSTIALSLI